MPFGVVYIANIILIITTLVFTVSIRRNLSKFSQSVAYFILAFLVIELILFQYTQENVLGPTKLYFNIKNGEFSLDSTFASMLLFSSGIVGIFTATTQRTWWQIVVWVYVAGLFLFLAVDEYFQIHEGFYSWEYVYSAVASVTSLGLFVFFRMVYPRRQLIAWLVIIGGMGMAAVGGIGIEKFVGDGCFGIIESRFCHNFPVIEELLESLGYGTALVGILLFAEQSIASKRWNRLKAVTVFTMICWVGICFYAYWLHPIVAYRLFATPVHANFADGQMVLIGYRLDKAYTHAGDDFNITMYWRSEQVPSYQYGYTINLIHPTTGESLIIDNKRIVNTSTQAWFTGTTHRISRTVNIPDDIETPVTSLVVITIWRRNKSTYRTIYPGETDSERFGEGSPIITQIPIISENTAEDDTPVYRFDNGARLLNYSINHDLTNELTMTFQWSTSERIPNELFQLLHLAHENGENYLIFDQPPFQSTFPTFSWIPEMSETSTWHVTIPVDALEGTYTIYTGLYDSQGIRVGVSESSGESLGDNLIALGEITIQDD